MAGRNMQVSLLVITMRNRLYVAIAVAIILLGIYGGYRYGENQYKNGYNAGYTYALESMSVPIETKQDTVQVGTTVSTSTSTYVKPKENPSQPSVAVKVEQPKIVATVNGKKYDFKPQSEVLDTTVKTTGVISVRVPERRWTAGIGYGKDRKVSYMLKAPIGKSAVGVWVAGSGKKNFMGGLSVSF